MADRFPETAQWLRERGTVVVQGMLERRAPRLDLRGWRRASRSQWEEMVEPSLGVRGVSVRAPLVALARVKDASKRLEAAHALADDLLARTPRDVVDHLIRAGLLAPAGGGHWSLEPPWHVTAWIEDWLRQQVTADDLGWGRLAFDPDKRDVLDRVLDRVVQEPGMLDRLLPHLPPLATTPAAIGAVEAVFAAVGRALEDGRMTACGTDKLHLLWAAQIGCCIHRYTTPSPPQPLSRRGSTDPWHDVPAWIRTSWAWSFGLPAPATPVPTAFVWLFPGWTRPPLASLPQHFGFYAHEGGPLFDHLVRHCQEDPTARPADTADFEVWTAWVLAQVLQGRDPHELSGKLVGWELVAGRLDLAEAERDPVQIERGRLVVRAVGRSLEPNAVLFQFTRPDYPNLRRLFLACIDEALAMELVTTVNVPARDVVGWLTKDVFPQRLHLPLVQWAVERDPQFWRHAPLDDTAVAHLADDALAWLARQLQGEWWSIVATWTRRDPEGAFAWLIEMRWQATAAHAVLTWLPAAHQDRLLAWIEAQAPEDRPEAVAWWAMYTLEKRPELVDRLLPILWLVGQG
ncbi:MAG: hypothetical protein EXR79_08775 [Myxococcales bacterium]|nr:hypothetical protein [Myxococcales bacterium]